MQENRFCSVCDVAFGGHSTSQLKKCELITRILKQDQEDLTQKKFQGLISAITIMLPTILNQKSKRKSYQRDEK